MVLPSDMLIVIAAPFIGSFLTTLAYRLPTGAPIAVARSACPRCGGVLSPLSLIPIISWVAQRGRCRRCQEPISPAYPLIELSAALLAVWAILTLPAASGWLLAASCMLGWTLLVLTLIDSRHFLLPDVLTLPLWVAGLIATYLINPDRVADHAVASVIGFATLALVNAIYRRLRGQDGLGLGDAKLLGAGGAWAGLAGLPGILLVASLSGLVWALARGALQRRLTARTRIAFGPFLSLGIWIIWLYGPLEVRWPM